KVLGYRLVKMTAIQRCQFRAHSNAVFCSRREVFLTGQTTGQLTGIEPTPLAAWIRADSDRQILAVARHSAQRHHPAIKLDNDLLAGFDTFARRRNTTNLQRTAPCLGHTQPKDNQKQGRERQYSARANSFHAGIKIGCRVDLGATVRLKGSTE